MGAAFFLFLGGAISQPSWAQANETVLYDFGPPNSGEVPQGPLVMDAAGNLYGTTQDGGQYLQGAVLAPVFYADASDARVAGFVDRYRAAYGEEPSVLDAIAFDAVRAARIALDHEGGQPNRGALATQLAKLGETGLTGDLSFTAAGERAGTPPLYVVDDGSVHALGSR